MKTVTQIEARVFAEAKRLAKEKESKARGVEMLIDLAFNAQTGIRAWAKQFLELEFNLMIGVSDATACETEGVLRQGH
jgi:hypothetical protein